MEPLPLLITPQPPPSPAIHALHGNDKVHSYGSATDPHPCSDKIHRLLSDSLLQSRANVSGGYRNTYEGRQRRARTQTPNALGLLKMMRIYIYTSLNAPQILWHYLERP